MTDEMLRRVSGALATSAVLLCANPSEAACIEPPAPPRLTPQSDPLGQTNLAYERLRSCLRHRAYAYRHLQNQPLVELAQGVAAQCRTEAEVYWGALDQRDRTYNERGRLEAQLGRNALDYSLEYRACASGKLVGPPAAGTDDSTPGPSWLERYQTTWAAILGFGGIILTLWANAGLARRQAREAEAREREGLRRALKAELSVLEGSFKSAAATLKAAQTDGSTNILLPAQSITSVYDASHAKLGLLGGDGITVLVSTYSLIKELPGRIELLAGDQIQPGGSYVRVGAKFFVSLEAMSRMALGEVEKAIQALDQGA